MSIPPADYDGAWKEALEHFLPECMALLVPAVHAAIAWDQGWEFLDKELQQVAVEAATGPRAVDKLARVQLRAGGEAWVLVHVEAQHQRDEGFAARMFTYHARLRDRFGRPVASVAILGDDEPGWRPMRFQAELLGSEIVFRFPMVKLFDYRAQLGQLRSEHNPFATVILAHLAALATRRDAEQRGRAKLALVRRLYDEGYDGAAVRRLYRLIDWLLRLPEAVEDRVWQEVRAMEEERTTTFITSAERIGIRQGRREGLVAGLELALAATFGAEGRRLAEELMRDADLARLEAVVERMRTGTTLAELRAVLQPPAA